MLSAVVLLTSTTFLSCVLLGLLAEFVLSTAGASPAPVARKLGE